MTEARIYVFVFLLPDGTWQRVVDDSGRVVGTAFWSVAWAFVNVLGSRSDYPVAMHAATLMELAKIVTMATTTWRNSPRWRFSLVEGQTTGDEDTARWTAELAERVPLPVGGIA